ncbi:hypothetical protein [Maioricimonas rarisocia]|nr:hypothetical protein [Maioricimonas rarisocia]
MKMTAADAKKPQLDDRWWSSRKPKLMKSTGLGKALKEYKQALAAFESVADEKTPPFSGFQAYMDAKSVLGGSVMSAVETGIRLDNGKRYQDTIAALKNYKSGVIPAEKTRLDKLFKTMKGRYDSTVKSWTEYNKAVIKIYEVAGNKSARAVLAAREQMRAAESAVTNAANAQRNGDTQTANAAVQTAKDAAEEIGKLKSGIASEQTDAKKSSWKYDKVILSDDDKKAFDRLGDKRTRSELQVENNLGTLTEMHSEALKLVKEAEGAAAGTAKLEDLYERTVERLVDRIFKYAQALDVPAREAGGNVDKVDGNLNRYPKAASEQDRKELKDEAVECLGKAVKWLDTLQKDIKKAEADVKKTLDSLPSDIVKPSNPEFVKLFKEVEKGMGFIEQDKAKGEKLKGKLQKLAPRVHELA